MSESFLGRWSRRKQAPAEVAQAEDERIAREQAEAQAALTPAAEANAAVSPAGLSSKAPPDLPLIESLTKDADFSAFMKPEVPPQLKNAALKKLFSDPHFNVMDGLDTYIDDYSRSDPIPESMLRQMASAKFLKLFDDDEDEEKKGAAAGAGDSPRESANNPTNETVAQSSYENPDIAPREPAGPPETSQPAPPVAGASQEDHAHTDLRLQPDHAAPAPGAGRGTQ